MAMKRKDGTALPDYCCVEPGCSNKGRGPRFRNLCLDSQIKLEKLPEKRREETYQFWVARRRAERKVG